MNLPNRLTILRIILTPAFLLVFQIEAIPHNYLIAMLIFIVASITDAADGHIARKHNMITNFGKIVDPIADKIMTTAVLLAFMSKGLCSMWIIILVLTREFTVSALRITAASQGLVIPANIFGKIKTASQMIFSIAILAMIMFKAEGVMTMAKLPVISAVLLWIMTAFTVISGCVYVRESTKVIDFSK